MRFEVANRIGHERRLLFDFLTRFVCEQPAFFAYANSSSTITQPCLIRSGETHECESGDMKRQEEQIVRRRISLGYLESCIAFVYVRRFETAITFTGEHACIAGHDADRSYLYRISDTLNRPQCCCLVHPCSGFAHAIHLFSSHKDTILSFRANNVWISMQ